jgi:superfamily II DNA/RNA helicase
VLVFTAFRQTQEALARELRAHDIKFAVYHGSLARADKEKAIGAFRDDAPVLLSTESAGEGRFAQARDPPVPAASAARPRPPT